jgi:GTP-binding protein
VLDQTFDLFDRLGATEAQLDFPVVYTSALLGTSGLAPDAMQGNMNILFRAIIDHCPPPPVDPHGPFQLQISVLDYSSYVGAIGIGRISRGVVHRNEQVIVVDHAGHTRKEKVGQILGFLGLERIEVQEARAGDIVAISGIESPQISDTLCDPTSVQALPPLTVDEPTISMTFETNTSPFAAREGRFVTSRQVRERLLREAMHNVALRVEDTEDPEKLKVSGRGELHLGILIENDAARRLRARRVAAAVVVREVDGVRHEPYETSPSTSRSSTRARSCRRSASAAASSRTCSPTARVACASITSFPRAG